MTTKKPDLLTETLSFSCSPEMDDKVQALAAKYDRAPSWILREIVKRYFDRFAKAQAARK